ncbi:hypothetical protein BDV06DRAFT_235338 [Aspergillus oleicola]
MSSLFRLRFASYIFLLYTPLFPIIGGAATAVNVVSGNIQVGENLDLVSFLNSRTQKHDELFTKALELLDSINSSSSCNKLAATKLVTSCESIGRKSEAPRNTDTYLALEHVRSLYAARLALCELSGAGITIPPSCQSVNVSPPARKVYFGLYTTNTPATRAADTVPKEGLAPCLKSLESRPQSWTSYSNSRQNAVVICQASRYEIDKEDLLQTYRVIAESSTKLNNGLHEALRMAAEESAKSRAFLQSIELLRKETLLQMEESTSSLVAKMSHTLDTRFTAAIDTVFSALSSVHIGFSSLQKDIQGSSKEADSLRHMLQYIHDELQLRSEQIALTQRQNAETQNELALSLQSKLHSIAQDEFKKLTQNVGTLDTSLEWLHARIVQILEQEVEASERLRGIGSSLEEFQLRADNLDRTQQRQYEIATAQWQLQADLQENIRISQAIVNQTMSQAANLHTMVGEAADAVEAIKQYIPGFGTFVTYLSWTTHGVCWIIFGTVALLILLVCMSVRYIFTLPR